MVIIITSHLITNVEAAFFSEAFQKTDFAKSIGWNKCYIEKGLVTKGKLLRNQKGNKNKFTFEHPVPSNVIADLILLDPNDDEKIKNILLKTNLVTVLTYEENSLLNKDLVANMPNNWSYDSGDFFARYKKSALEIPSERIEVHGAIKR